MERLLTFAYEHPPKIHKNELLDRKKYLLQENTILYFVSHSGATSMILLFLSKFLWKEYLYIDKSDILFNDFDDEIFCDGIYDFLIKNEQIEVVIIENTKNSLPLLNKDGMTYIVSQNIQYYKSPTNKYKDIFLYPLDFEEYILFKKHRPDNTFNVFIKDSTFASFSIKEPIVFHLELQKIISCIILNTQEREVFLLYLKYQGSVVSVFHLYNQIRKKIKISKDKFYEQSKILEKKMLLFLIKKHNKEKGNKKTYFIDFNLPKAINTAINVKSSIENAILLEFVKKDIAVNDIYYTDELTFYIPRKKLAIVLMIFKELQDIQEHKWYLDAMVPYNKDELEKILFITIDDAISGYIEEVNNKKYEILTFWEFATRGDI